MNIRNINEVNEITVDENDMIVSAKINGIVVLYEKMDDALKAGIKHAVMIAKEKLGQNHEKVISEKSKDDEECNCVACVFLKEYEQAIIRKCGKKFEEKEFSDAYAAALDVFVKHKFDELITKKFDTKTKSIQILIENNEKMFLENEMLKKQINQALDEFKKHLILRQVQSLLLQELIEGKHDAAYLK